MENISLSGKLEFLEFADLIQLIGNNGSTGILKVSNPQAASPATIYIDKGNPINASQGNLSGIDALFSLFGWTEKGEFQFIEESVPVKRVINKNRMEIILEGLQLLDDGKIPILGPKPQQQTATGPSENMSGVPTIKGPLVDYIYIADEETFRNGDKIVEEGKFGSWMWVILEGIVKIVKDTPHGPMELLRISEGSFVGNISTFLARQHVRGASAIAEGTVQLGVVDSQRLSNEFSAMSKQFRGLLLGFDNRLGQTSSHTLRIRLNQPVLLDLQEEFSPIEYDEEADQDQVYIIQQGKAAVVRKIDDVNVIIAELLPGDFVGQIPFLNTGHEPYSATVYGTSDIELIPIDLVPLQKEYDRLSNTFKNIIENISSSIMATTQVASVFFQQNFESSH
jgi:CRP-like cAMP-binding protein